MKSDLAREMIGRPDTEHAYAIRNGLLCGLLVAACVLATCPVTDMPSGDDFSYAKTALDFARTGHFIYNGWATAMLGWLVPWGALFIKVFGFSFTVLRLSMLPFDIASVYLFHQILLAFGIRPRNAAFGALTLGLSPLFLPLGAIYMTDVPGLLVILLCIYMCQRAYAAESDKAALLWLCSAALVNVLGGTVRQIGWLGALVIVPSTAWLVRKRRGMKTAGIASWIASLIGVYLFLQWFERQPYSVPESVDIGPIGFGMLFRLTCQLAKTFFCLLLVVFPVLVAWLPSWRRLGSKVQMQVAGAMIVLAAISIVLDTKGVLDRWVMPWLVPILWLSITPDIFNLWMRLAISLFVALSALILVGCLRTSMRGGQESLIRQNSNWRNILLILGPFSLCYVLLLVPRAATIFLQDRYVLDLMPVAIVVLLVVYEQRVAPCLPAVSFVTIALFAFFGIAGAHDTFAGERALVTLLESARASGVPRNSIQAGLSSDGWFQIESGGHINEPKIKVPAGAYNPDVPSLKLPVECLSWFARYTPAITPEYILVPSPASCLGAVKYSVIYHAWAPPSLRTFYLQQLRENSR